MLTRSQKDEALEAMAVALAAAETEVLTANAVDVDAARDAGTSDAIIDRLLLDPARLAGMGRSAGSVAARATDSGFPGRSGRVW